MRVFYKYPIWEIGESDPENLNLIIFVLIGTNPSIHFYWGGYRGGDEASEKEIHSLIKLLFEGYPIVGKL
jgi:hypothetical protein